MNNIKNSIIIKRGIIVNKNCLRCDNKFEVEEGIVTINGILPLHYFCEKCDKAILREINKAYKEYIKNINQF